MNASTNVGALNKSIAKGKEKATDLKSPIQKPAQEAEGESYSKAGTSKLSTSIAPEKDPRVTVVVLVDGQLRTDTLRGASNLDWLCKWNECTGAFRWDPSGKWSWFPKASANSWGAQVELSNLRQARMKSLGISLEPRDDPRFNINILYKE